MPHSVSIHAFRGEGDAITTGMSRDRERFQSTPSGGKATPRDGVANNEGGVSIHAFRGEGDR